MRQRVPISRRRILGSAALAAAAAVSRPFAAFGQTAQGRLSLTPVAGRNLSVITGAGGNVVVRTSAAGMLLVDSGARESADTLLAALAALPGGGRVAQLFNTHWHAEQIGANAALGRAGARIIAHEKTRLRLATDYYLPEEDRYEPAQPEEAWPGESFYTGGATTFDGEQIEYAYLLQAHTDGDIYVRFTGANVVAVGDALAPVRDPVLDWFGGGWLGGRADSLALLLDIGDAATRYVPSYGPVVGRDYLEAEHRLIVTLYDRVQEHVRKGMSAEDILAAGVMDGIGRTLDDPLGFLRAAHKGMWAHHNTLSHDIV